MPEKSQARGQPSPFEVPEASMSAAGVPADAAPAAGLDEGQTRPSGGSRSCSSIEGANERGALDRHAAHFLEGSARLPPVNPEPSRRAFSVRRTPLSTTEITPEACAADSRASAARPRPSTHATTSKRFRSPSRSPDLVDDPSHRMRSGWWSQFRSDVDLNESGLENRFGGDSSDDGSNPSPSVFAEPGSVSWSRRLLVTGRGLRGLDRG
jgi:hypothetical protein